MLGRKPLKSLYTHFKQSLVPWFITTAGLLPCLWVWLYTTATTGQHTVRQGWANIFHGGPQEKLIKLLWARHIFYCWLPFSVLPCDELWDYYYYFVGNVQNLMFYSVWRLQAERVNQGLSYFLFFHLMSHCCLTLMVICMGQVLVANVANCYG